MYLKHGLLLVAAALFLQSATAQKISDKKIVKQLKKDIGYLASDELEGRNTGSKGERLAADYIIEYYKENGIQSYQGKYRHPFTFVVGRSLTEKANISVNAEKLTEEEGFVLAFSGNGSIAGEVTPDVMEMDKIWMVSLYDDEEQANDAHYNWEKDAFEFCQNAAKHGATAVIFYDKYDAKYPAVFNKGTEYEALSMPVAYVTYKGYEKHIKGNGSIKIGVVADLKDKKLTGNNILAYKDNDAEHTVVIGAHYDHLGFGKDGGSLHAAKDGAIHNGADDNASGSAALMQFAHWINQSELKKYNYLLMHFSAEEMGLIGSKKVVEQLGLSGDKVAYMINMDMVGRLNEGTHALTVGGVGTSPAWGKVVNMNDPNFKIGVDSSGVGPSDHTSFYHKDIPVLFFFTGTHKDYHKPSDDADKINYEGEAQIMHYIYNIITQMETMPKPEFTKTKQKTVGKVRFKVTLGVMPDYSFNDGGLRIDGVSDGRPAANAGIQAGDIVIKIGEHDIRGIQTYMEALSKFEPGETTKVTVKRGEEELTMPLTFTPKK